MLLKRIAIFFMLLTVLNQTFTTVSTLVAFKVNQQNIAEMLCVNKNRPELQCNGKCVLMQRIQAEVDKAQAKGQQMLQNLIERDVVWVFENWDLIPLFNNNTLSFQSAAPTQAQHQWVFQSLLSDIFHPPIIG